MNIISIGMIICGMVIVILSGLSSYYDLLFPAGVLVGAGIVTITE